MISDTSTGWFEVLGRLHPLVLHLPIGLWVGIACLEFGSAIVRRRVPRAAVVTLAWVAAIGGCIAAGTGWVLALEGEWDTGLVDRHRWLGVAVALIGVLAAALAGFRGRQAFRLLLMVVLAVMLPAGHLGSEITRRPGFLFEPLVPKTRHSQQPAPGVSAMDPAASHPAASHPAASHPATGSPATGAPTTGDPAIHDPLRDPAAPVVNATASGADATFAATIAPILERNCTQCHNEQKHKGRLLLDTPVGIQKGGKNGAALVAGDPDASEMLLRTALPLDDEDHMPPEGKPQPTAAELALLRAWIAAGAPFEDAFPLAAAPVAPPDAGVKGTAAPTSGAPAAGTPDASTGGSGSQGTDIPGTGTQGTSNQGTGTQGTGPAKDPPAPAPQGNGGTPRGGDDEAAIAALRERLVHVAPVAAGDPGLWIDFAAVAPTTSDAEVQSLLRPLAPRIADLGLARAPVGDALLPLCAAMPRLHRLDLRATNVTAAGLGHLTALPELRELVLAQTHVGDDAVAALLAMPALQIVYVWQAGLGQDALGRLRARADLRVDAGDAPPAAALAAEGKLEFTNDLPPPGQPAAEAAVAAALRPVNTTCPVSGQPVDPRFVIVHQQKAIGFCCPNCPKEFWAAPEKYQVPGN